MNVLASDIIQCLSGEATYLVRVEDEIKTKNGYESNPPQNKDKKSLSPFQKRRRKPLDFG